MFQFTRPRGARPSTPDTTSDAGRFNSRAREGRDERSQRRHGGVFEVSIHAPARGATLRDSPRTRKMASFQFTRPRGARRNVLSVRNTIRRVSIHAPARGATTLVMTSFSSSPFQFTRPRGARPTAPIATSFASASVSIHAPARGATDMVYFCIRCFNSRAREGRDRPTIRRSWHGTSFNSRAREGRDWSV